MWHGGSAQPPRRERMRPERDDGEIGHFIQADTIVPDPGEVIAWNRYAYVNFSPTKHVDPSGHSGHLPVSYNVLITDTGSWKGVVSGENTSQPRIDNDFYGYGCSTSLTSCYNQGELSDLRNGQVGEAEFNELLETVATDIRNGMALPTIIGGILSGRHTFDTPFYNGGGRGGLSDPPYDADQIVCIGDQGCWGRSEINYFAQGMWSADAGESLDRALEYTSTWNFMNYQLSSAEIQGKLYWTEFGYLWYQNWSERNKN